MIIMMMIIKYQAPRGQWGLFNDYNDCDDYHHDYHHNDNDNDDNDN